MLNFFSFLPAVWLGGEAVTAFQESFTFRFLLALSDLNFSVHFADRVHTQAGQRGKNWRGHGAKPERVSAAERSALLAEDHLT